MATVTELPGGTSADTLPAAGDPSKEKGDNWRFIEAQPIREDQVDNAVKFLSHPKVKGSPVVYRRSFLERKGLTREEIDEAFRRVPVSWCSSLYMR
jgi:peroxin-14